MAPNKGLDNPGQYMPGCQNIPSQADIQAQLQYNEENEIIC